MARRAHEPLPNVDPSSAPSPDDPDYADWVERVAFSPEGVDRGLIRSSLDRTPEERLAHLQEFAATVVSARRGRRTAVR